MNALVQHKYHKVGRWGQTIVDKVVITDRHLDYLYPLFIHSTLPTHVLHALAGRDVQQRTTSDTLFLLKHRPNGYVSQPRAQREAENANYSHLVFELTDKGARALVDGCRISYADYLLWIKVRRQYRAPHFDHDLATGYAAASIQLACRAQGLKFISWRDILGRDKCPREAKDADNPLGIPHKSGATTRYITPDNLFGIEYGVGACFFALETDMGTEQQSERADGSTSIEQKVKGYREIIHAQEFKTRFGLPSLQVMFLTIGVVRMHGIIQTVARIASKDGKGSARPFLFKAVPAFLNRTHAPLPATGHVLTEPWFLVHGKPIDLARNEPRG